MSRRSFKAQKPQGLLGVFGIIGSPTRSGDVDEELYRRVHDWSSSCFAWQVAVEFAWGDGAQEGLSEWWMLREVLPWCHAAFSRRRRGRTRRLAQCPDLEQGDHFGAQNILGIHPV